MFNDRRINVILCVVSLFSISIANASFLFPSSNNTRQNAAITPNTVVSPDEFINKVNSLNRQNQAALNNQVQGLLSNQPQLPPPPAGIKKQPGVTAPVNQPKENLPPVEENAGNSPEEIQPPEESIEKPAPAPQTASQPENQGGYSGFIGTGGSSTTNKGSTTKSNSSSGWGVKY